MTPIFDDNDQPKAWPVCAECKAPFVYRWGMRLAGKAGFLWFRDCKHKGADIETFVRENAGAES